MTSEADLRAVTIVEPDRLDGQVRIADYDARWSATFEHEAARIRGALGARVSFLSMSAPRPCRAARPAGC